jgi:hypothetical protein
MIWNDIPGWEERYLISEFGDVKSKDMIVRAKGGVTATRKGRDLKLVKKTNGYYCVTLTNGNDRPQVSVHRLVARTFIGECPLGLHVLHSDGVKSNNHYSNLRYGTPADNHADTLAHGHRLFGVDIPTSKLDDDKVRYIRESDESALNLANKFNVCKGHIYQIRRNKVWKHVL